MKKRHKPADFRCPSCGSSRVRRPHRRGFVERIFLRFLRLRPYHCLDCYNRFYSHSWPIDVQQHEPPVMADHPKLLQDHPSLETNIPGNGGQVERRGFSRLRCQIPARLAVGSGSRITGVVSGISLNGCFIETPNAVPVGSEIELSLEVGTGTHSRGLVRSSLTARGMGIEFIFMTVPNFRRLQDIARGSVRLHVSA
jgi:hypothetical protein